MVCSACGFENPKAMRFCGMCGTPLPQRPLTAPGAHSTLNFTRVPMEGAVAGGQNAGSAPSSHTGRRTETRAPSATLADPRDLAEHRPASSAVPPVEELVPDVPLDEYLQSFQYRPPSEPIETTMRGETAAEERPVAADKTPQPTSMVATTPVEAGTTPSTAEKPQQASAFAAADGVESRLGLELEGPSDAAPASADRPRFLDIAEPVKQPKPATSGTSTIVGPSFLGLSDAPPAVETIDFDAEEPARASHWRIWLAIALVVLFAGLGLMEWHAQAHQTNNGPVQLVQTEIHNWRHGLLASLLSKVTSNTISVENRPATPAPSLPDNNGKPEMQVQEQPHPQPPSQPAPGNPAAIPAANSNPPAASAQPAASAAVTTPANPKPTPEASATSTSAPSTAEKVAPKTPSSLTAAAANTASKSSSADEAPKKAAEEPKPTRNAAKPDVPGAEEMAKAANASDSAAEAAWLWKATAKGNPDAPVKLANMYMKGDGVPQSCEQAVVLLRTAATKENAPARNRLASMYATGNCVPRNRVEAYRWLSSALVADPNSQWAQQNRDLIWQQMTAEERVLAEKYR
ncbi:MAG TPA: hypothetical protein VKV05_09825 [Terriglobales bacterium]|nr:hypothetical protein [Terriglobales bacterium]